MNKLLIHMINAGSVDHRVLPGLKLPKAQTGKEVKSKLGENVIVDGKKMNTYSDEYEQAYNKGIGQWRKYNSTTGQWELLPNNLPSSQYANAEFISNPRELPEVVVSSKINSNVAAARKKAIEQAGTYQDYVKREQSTVPKWAEAMGFDNKEADKKIYDENYNKLLNTRTYQNLIDAIPQNEDESRIDYINRFNRLAGKNAVELARKANVTEPFEPSNLDKLKQWGWKGLNHIGAGAESLFTSTPKDFMSTIQSGIDRGNQPVSGMLPDEAKQVGIMQPFETADDLAFRYAFKPALMAGDNLVDPSGKQSRAFNSRNLGASDTDKIFTSILNPINYIGPGEIFNGGKNLAKVTRVGEGLENLGKFAVTKTPLKNTWKYNPYAETLAGKTQRQIFGDEAYNSFLEHGPTTQPELSQAEQLAQWNALKDKAEGVRHGSTGDIMNIAGTTKFTSNGMRMGVDYPFAYFSEGTPWYGPQRSASMAEALGQERRIVPKVGKDLNFYPAGESSIIFNPKELSQQSISSYAGRRRVLSPEGQANLPQAFDVYNGTPHWLQGYKKIVDPKTLAFEKNLQDLNYAKSIYGPLGYQIPENLDRIAQSDLLTDRTVRGLARRDNTVFRGISTNMDDVKKRTLNKFGVEEGTKKFNTLIENLKGAGIDPYSDPKGVAEYMATHIPGNTGAGRVNLDMKKLDKKRLNGLYTSNSEGTAEGYTYGNGYIVKAEKPTDFSSKNRRDWVDKNIPQIQSGEDYKLPWLSNKPISWKTDYEVLNKHLIDSYRQKLGEQKLLAEYPEIGTLHNYSWDNVHPELQKILDRKDQLQRLADEEYEMAREYYENKMFSARDRINKRVMYHDMNNYSTPRRFLRNITSPTFIKDVFTEPLYERKLRKLGQKNAEDWMKASVTPYIEKYPELLNEFPEVNPYAHYIHIGKPGQKVLKPVSLKQITPDIWKNKSRGHEGEYSRQATRREFGGMYEDGDPIVDPMGQWAHPGKRTLVPTQNGRITMKNVFYPVYGKDETGYGQMMYPGQEYQFPGTMVDEHPVMKNGGYVVTRSHDRKGKTHKVTGPDGTVKYFGDSHLGQHPKDPERKAAFYARHKHNLEHNPFFRAYARATWEDGGPVEMQTGGTNLFQNNKTAYVDSVLNANKDLNWVKRLYDQHPQTIQIPGQPYTSTHFMGDNGKGYVFPTVVEQNNKLVYLGDNAENYARRTNTGIQFPSQQGSWFANNGYKKGTNVLNGYDQGGEMIRRADGHYSQRGLWDNIRANKGSGKKPTKEMLEQEHKIRKAQFGLANFTTMMPLYTKIMDWWNKEPTEEEKKQAIIKAQQHAPYADNESIAMNIAEIFDPTGISSWDDLSRTVQDPTSDWWDYTVAGASVIPLFGKIGMGLKGTTKAAKAIKGLTAFEKTIQAEKAMAEAAQVAKLAQAAKLAKETSLGRKVLNGVRVTADALSGSMPMRWIDRALNPAAQATRVLTNPIATRLPNYVMKPIRLANDFNASNRFMTGVGLGADYFANKYYTPTTPSLNPAPGPYGINPSGRVDSFAYDQNDGVPKGELIKLVDDKGRIIETHTNDKRLMNLYNSGLIDTTGATGWDQKNNAWRLKKGTKY